MVDFPKKGSASDVWTYATRELNADGSNAVRDAVLSDATKIAGAKVDANISTRAAPTDILVNPANKVDGAKVDANITSRAAPADILVTPGEKVDGVKLDATVSSRSTLTQAQILSDATPLPGARIATIPAADAPTEASTLTDGTEQILIEKDFSGAGTSLRLFGSIDATPMLAGDSIRVRQYMTVKAAGTYAIYSDETFTFTQVQNAPLIMVATAWTTRKLKVTIMRTAGVDRTYDHAWQVERK